MRYADVHREVLPVPDIERFKQAAAVAALERIQPGMVIGLGTGSTARYFIEELGERLRQRRLAGVTGVPTSEETAALAVQLGIPLTGVGQSPIAFAFDGADEITPGLALTKGGGGALLREKIVAARRCGSLSLPTSRSSSTGSARTHDTNRGVDVWRAAGPWIISVDLATRHCGSPPGSRS